MKSSINIKRALLSVLLFSFTAASGGCDDDSTWEKVDTSKGEVIRTMVLLELVRPFYVGGTVTGLTGTLILQNNGADNLIIISAGPDVTFHFATGILRNQPYDVTVYSEPADQDCTVSNGTGTIDNSDITDVTVECVTP